MSRFPLKISVLIYLSAIGAILSLPACKKDSAKLQQKNLPDNTCSKSYTNDVFPLILTKCAMQGCHTANFPFGDFTTFNDLRLKIENGKVQSLVFQYSLMPPQEKAQLTGEEKDVLRCWIKNGAPRN